MAAPVIPAELRPALGLSPGDTLHLSLMGHRLALETSSWRRRRTARPGLAGAQERSLVDEWLNDRGLAAAAGE